MPRGVGTSAGRALLRHVSVGYQRSDRLRASADAVAPSSREQDIERNQSSAADACGHAA